MGWFGGRKKAIILGKCQTPGCGGTIQATEEYAPQCAGSWTYVHSHEGGFTAHKKGCGVVYTITMTPVERRRASHG